MKKLDILIAVLLLPATVLVAAALLGEIVLPLAQASAAVKVGVLVLSVATAAGLRLLVQRVS